MQPRQGVVWLLCSDFIKSIPNSFYRECKSWINHLAENYDSIYNFVYEKNWLALKWLQLSGFTVAKKLKVGPYKKNFYLIVKDKDEICVTQQQSQ
jgi:ribosomal protein S18 acetylase RimI-like enzyme